MLDFDDPASGEDLLVSRGGLDVVDRPARHAGGNEQLEPLRRRPAREYRMQFGQQFVSMGGARGEVGEARVDQQVLALETLEQQDPELLLGAGDGDPAVPRCKHLEGDDRRVRRVR